MAATETLPRRAADHTGSMNGHEPDSTLLRRRDFLQRAALGAAAVTVGALTPSVAEDAKTDLNPLPRWRGFNLTNFFQALSRDEQGQGMAAEDDLRWIRDWGFDFVRLPMDYWLWIDSDWKNTRKLQSDDVLKISENALAKVDRTVELCLVGDFFDKALYYLARGYEMEARAAQGSRSG